MRRAQTWTVTLGPFFLSLATEGPGSKRKTMEPTMRAAAKSTFMLRSERRSIHRQQQERSREPGPEKGVDTRCARVAARARGGPGPEGGLAARGAGHYPPAPPRRVVGAAAGGAEGVCHVTTLRLDVRLAPPAASRRCAKAVLRLVLEKKTTKPGMPCGLSGCVKQSLPNLGVIFKNWTY